MKNTWKHYFRRLATTCLVCGATAWSSAMCYAVQLAFDSASDPVYANGWDGTTTNDDTGMQETTGDNGGFGFSPWDFDNDWLFSPGTGTLTIDSTNQFNNLGTAWRMALGSNTDILRAGRGLPALQTGQTIRVVFDNPTERRGFRGYFVRFNSRNAQPGERGGGNICYGSDPCSTAMGMPIDVTPVPKLNVWVFDFFSTESSGHWRVNGETGQFIPLWDADDPMAMPPQVGTNSGAQLDVEITGPDAYKLTFTPLDNSAAAYTETGMLASPDEPLDWLEFTFFNTLSEDGFETDFFIKSIEIFDNVTAGIPGDYNSNGAVDAADYVVWRDRAGQTFQLANEVSGVTPGMVTPEDYDAWRARFGNMAGSGTGIGISAAAVPEPATFVYPVGAMLGLSALGLRTVMRR